MTVFDDIAGFCNTSICHPFIESIRFPRFRNLSEGTSILFSHPITALVGPNGTNKSSILRALQGCPDQYNIGDYWFDTPLDPLADADDARQPNRYIHSYRTPSGHLAEVIKTRVGKASRGPDYFETSAPRRRDGMARVPTDADADPRDAGLHGKTRWKPIEKRVVYLDFRQELPAYDILFHFNWRGQDNSIEWKKRRIRKGGPHVGRAISDKEARHILYGKNRILEPAERLSPEEKAAVERILDRTYSEIGLVKHDYFGVEGYTATLHSGGRSYSEAYAGSGEFAAIMLVRQISRAEPKSLILLDEPETSLHPGAQRALMEFVAAQCKTKKHQVILATHAPAMVESLPDESRKLLQIDAFTGKVRLVSQAASADEAFIRLGMHPSRRSILVEDELARELVLRAARIKGVDFLSSLDVLPVPGGAQGLKQRVLPIEAQVASECTILLDGDQRPSTPLKQSFEISDSEVAAELAKIDINTQSLLRDGGRGDQTERTLDIQRRTLDWAHARLKFLPGGDPEALILDMCGQAASGDSKSRWVEITRNDLGVLPTETVNASQILETQKRALANVLDTHPALVEIVNLLESIESRISLRR